MRKSEKKFMVATSTNVACPKLNLLLFFSLKFIYSEKATKFCKISTLHLSVCTLDKSKVEISQNVMAFSEYTNFKNARMNDTCFAKKDRTIT